MELIQKEIVVKKSPIHGRGVFAKSDIPAEALIEECCRLFCDYHDSSLRNYAFICEKQKFVLTGYGCLYNHADNPNVEYSIDYVRNVMVFKTKRLIKKDEELFISYGTDWFSSRNIQPNKISSLHKFMHFLKGIPLRFFITVAVLMSIYYLLSHTFFS